MGVTYLDERDIVRFDTTPDAALAREAAINRGFLELHRALEEMILTSVQVQALRGSASVGSITEQALRELRDIEAKRQRIFAECDAREQVHS
jgi:hypothetical protein